MSYSKDCKRRGIKLALTYWQRDLWKKWYDGKAHYFKGEDTKAGYDAALAAYIAERNRPTFADEGEHLAQARSAVEWYRQNGEPDGEAGQATALARFWSLPR